MSGIARAAESRSAGISAAGLLRAATRPWVLTLIWIITIFAFLSMILRLPDRANQPDFSHYYVSSLALLHHQNPYDSNLTPLANRIGLQLRAIDHATNPPAFILCFEPFAMMPPRTAYWTWTALNLAALGFALYLLMFKVTRLESGTAWFIAAMALTYPPVTDHFRYAQTQILILLMIVIAARWMDEGKEAGAGVMLAFATLIRVFPILLAGYLVVRRRWRALGYMAAGITAGVMLTLVMAGAGVSLSFVGRVSFLTGGFWIYRTVNVALGSFVARLFVYANGGIPSGMLGLVSRIVARGTELGLLIVTVVATRGRADECDEDWRALTLWIVATIMLSPTAWFHYLVLLLIVYFQIFSAAQNGRASRRATMAAIGSYLLIVFAKLGIVLIGDATAPAIGTILNECEFGTLAVAYVAAYWFVCDGVASASRKGRLEAVRMVS